MTRMLVTTAALAIATSGALACPFQKSVSLDTQTVASIDQTAPISTSQELLAAQKAKQEAAATQPSE